MFNPFLSADWDVGQGVTEVSHGVTAGALVFYKAIPENLMIFIESACK